ncbi:MAG TPA: Y-family DNA polymerase [Pyrinomonadaceae bacterium]|nr:Y-family DNA polymerase [Pyrinomonadaceae bacterium]
MRPPVFALVDCDDFYVSCERVFAPRLRGRVVVVLSNNDGCVVSRSAEAKAIGVTMGAPLFKVRGLLDAHGAKIFSSNYELYGDMSRRVRRVLEECAPEVETYSVDEWFLNLSCFREEELTDVARRVREKIKKWLGLPASVGVAATKTLAKLAARLAKRSPKSVGVVNLFNSPHAERALALTAVGDVWGVGPRLSAKLNARGVRTALDLRDAEERRMRRLGGVVLQRIVLELRGVSCLPLSVCPPDRKSVVCSRSFGRAVETFDELREAAAFHACRAGVKLRRARLAANVLVVFAGTSRFETEGRYENSATLALPAPTDYTPELIRHARLGVEEIYRAGVRFKKAGVMLLDLVPAAPVQSVMHDRCDRARAARLMQTLDEVAARMGHRALRFAAAGFDQRWRMLSLERSPRCTTRWAELLRLRPSPAE